jgi:predicted nucleotidyltransferase
MNEKEKKRIKNQVIELLKDEREVKRIVIFGSFLTSSDPRDIDIAVFQNSDQPYIPLAMKYRKKMRPLSQKIALDVIPIKENAQHSQFLLEVNSGELIYER